MGRTLSDADLHAISELIKTNEKPCSFSPGEITALKTTAKMINTATEQVANAVVALLIFGLGCMAYFVYGFKGTQK